MTLQALQHDVGSVVCRFGLSARLADATLGQPASNVLVETILIVEGYHVCHRFGSPVSSANPLKLLRFLKQTALYARVPAWGEHAAPMLDNPCDRAGRTNKPPGAQARPHRQVVVLLADAFDAACVHVAFRTRAGGKRVGVVS
jgi:hypothetical protein